MQHRGNTSRRTRAAALLVAVGALLTASLATAPAADAGCDILHPDQCGGSTSGGSTQDTTTSSPTQTASYTTPQRSCSVYANGAGMGSYCTTIGGGTLKSLRERFPGQVFDRCRYSEVPASMPVPFNSRPGEGKYMLMQCIDNVDFDTFSGGTQRTLDIQVVWVPNGTDTTIHHNGITDFLWQAVQSGAQMPVPFLRTRPNTTPVVGYPTYFTFRWLDPATRQVVAEGPYAGRADGGPFKQIDSGGLLIRASGVKVTVDPRQKGIPSTTCPADTPYREGASPSQQPADACKITFPRSSASARQYAEDQIPSDVDDAFYAAVSVEWRVTYGEAGDLHQLGNGFTMRVRQVLPVQEVQVPDQPPTAIY